MIWDFGGQGTVTTSSTITSQNFNFINPGNYQVIVTALNECPNSVNSSVSVNILEPINITTLTPIYICNNDPYTLTAAITGQPTNVIWSDQSNFSTQLNSGPTDYDIVVTNSGTYYIQATNGFCSDTASTTITFNSPSQASFTPNQPIGCGPLTVTFDNTSVQTQSFVWDFGNGQIDSVNFEPSVTYDSVGQYQVSLAIFDPSCPASDTAYFSIEVIPAVTSSLNDLVSLCDTVPVLLVGNTNGTATEFLWSSNSNLLDTLNSSLLDSTLNLTNPQSGYYYFFASNGYCSASDSVNIYFDELSVDLFAPDSVCYNDLIEVVATISPPSDDFIYNWSSQYFDLPSGNDTLSYFLAMMQGSHTVYLTVERENCTALDSTFINVSFMGDVVSATVSQSIVTTGSVVVLTALPNSYESYSWTPSDGVNFPNSPQTEVTVNENIVFTVTAKEGACTLIDTVEVKVYEIICEDPFVFIPNAFSPNGDNNNDVLFVRGLFIEKMIFRVFDRWGEMVFESSDPAIGWDGTFRDKKLDPDVYDYYLDVTCIGGLKSISKGNVTLMK